MQIIKVTFTITALLGVHGQPGGKGGGGKGGGGGGVGGGGTPGGGADYSGPGPHASPLRGTIATVDDPIDGNSLIFGPFEAGFSAQQTAQFFGCTNVAIAGGLDTLLAEQMVELECDKDRESVSILDDCGGHAQPYHYHEKMTCLYESGAGGHSTRIGTALDGHGIYGQFISAHVKANDLDACGGRWGVTPDSGGERVYYYMVQDVAPFTVGCFGGTLDDGITVSLAECRALYSSCGDGDVRDVSTRDGTWKYDPDCPCFDAAGSNVEGSPPVPPRTDVYGNPVERPPPEVTALPSPPPSVSPSPPPSASPSPPPSSSPSPPPSPKPPPSSKPPPPPKPPSTTESVIPTGGVQILRGDGKGFEKCLMPGDEKLTSLEGQTSRYPRIAAQCCTSVGVCAREHAGTCIAGNSKALKGAIEAFTYGEAEAKCSGLGLQLCEQSCAGSGCWYNLHPVHTKLPCEASPPPPPQDGCSCDEASNGRRKLNSAENSYTYGAEQPDATESKPDGTDGADGPMHPLGAVQVAQGSSRMQGLPTSASVSVMIGVGVGGLLIGISTGVVAGTYLKRAHQRSTQITNHASLSADQNDKTATTPHTPSSSDV